MPFAMLIAYVPEYADEYSGLDLRAAAKIARERDQQAADDLALDCNPDLFGLSPSDARFTASVAA